MFAALNNYFDKIYLLTLEKATERHVVFKQILNGLDYQVVYGIDKDNLSIEALQQQKEYDPELAKKSNVFTRPFRLGEIACSLGHKMMYTDMLQHGYEKVLILEDDVLPNEGALKNFENIIAQLPKDADLLYLGFYKYENPPKFAFFKKLIYHIKYTLGINKWNHRIIRNLYPKKVNDYFSKAGFHDCTHAYMINRKAAGILLEMQSPVIYLSDNALSYAITTEKINGYICTPKFFNQPFQINESGEQESYIR